LFLKEITDGEVTILWWWWTFPNICNSISKKHQYS